VSQPHVEFVGEISDAQKPAFLSGAKALLFPIDWAEPFGLVMIEAMVCGTPVIAFNRGSVCEFVEDGVTGYIVDDVDGALRRWVARRRFVARRFALASLSGLRLTRWPANTSINTPHSPAQQAANRCWPSESRAVATDNSSARLPTPNGLVLETRRDDSACGYVRCWQYRARKTL